MNKQTALVSQQPETIESLNDLIIDSIQDIKGKHIIKLDLRALDDAPTDFFIICEGESTTQVNAISSNIQKRLKTELDTAPNHVEGRAGAKWVLVDYFNTVVHVFHPEFRSYYELEDLWSDAKSIEYADL